MPCRMKHYSNFAYIKERKTFSDASLELLVLHPFQLYFKKKLTLRNLL